MSEVLISPLEKARKAHSELLRVMGINGKQGALSVAMGTSDTTVSKLKTEGHIEKTIQLLYCAGFKVVPSDMRCYPGQDVEAWYSSYRRELLRSETAAQLFKDEE